MKAITLFSLSLLTAHVNAAEPQARDFGMPVSAKISGRKIEIKSDTRHVNVFDGETVHFLIDGKQFDWHFNTRTREAVLDLKTIVPSDLKVGDVRVWVMPNPIYQG